MKKLKLISFKQESNRLVFIIGKNQNLENFLSKFLQISGFRDNLYVAYYRAEKVNVEKLQDVEHHYINKIFDIDIVYGCKSVIILVRTKNKETQKKIKYIIMKYLSFKNEK